MPAGEERASTPNNGEGTSATGRHESQVNHPSSRLSQRRTWSNTSRNLEQFPSFPHNIRNSNTHNITNQSLPPPPPQPRDSIYLSTHPSIWPGATFNTAGEGPPTFTRDANGTYVHPEYASYSSGAGWPDNSPLWSLAKPLPRMVNESMRRRHQHDDGESAQDDSFVEGREKGDVEAAPWTRALSPDSHGRESLDRVRSGARRAVHGSSGAGGRDRTHTGLSLSQTNSQARKSSLSRLESVRNTDSTKAKRARDRATTSAKDMVGIPPSVPEERPTEATQPEGAESQHKGQLGDTESEPESGEQEIEPQQVREEERPDQKSGKSRTFPVKTDAALLKYLHRICYTVGLCPFSTESAICRVSCRKPVQSTYCSNLISLHQTTVALTIGYCGNFAQVTSPSTPVISTSSLTSSLTWAFGTMTAIYIGGV